MPVTAARRREVRGPTVGVGKPGHWSACSLASRRGEAPGLSWPPWTPLGAGLETWWWCDASLPRGLLFCSASFLQLPLPRNLGWAVHASSTWSRGSTTSSSNLWLKGCTTQCCVPWQWGTVKSSYLARQGGLATTMGLHASARRRAVRVVRLEAAAANGRRSWPDFQRIRKIPRSRRSGEFWADLSPIKLPSSALSASTSARGFSARLMLGEGLRGATRSLATFFGHVL